MLALVLAVRFAVELCLFVSVGILAANTSYSLSVRVLAATAAVVVLVVVWGLLLAPKARIGLPIQVRVVLELGLFALASIGLWGVGHHVAGVLLFAADVTILITLFSMGQEPGSQYPGLQQDGQPG